MSSALNLLTSIGGSGESKPYLGFPKLDYGNHEIKLFRLVNNKNYNAATEGSLKRILLVELEDQVLFLPAYFAKSLQDDKAVAELNSGGKKYLYFGGKRSNK